jgi:hypothetical protein
MTRQWIAEFMLVWSGKVRLLGLKGHHGKRTPQAADPSCAIQLAGS